MNIVLAADHGGFELKEELKNVLLGGNYEVIDVGCLTSDSVDYPDFAEKGVKELQTDGSALGIFICGTGIGMSMVANRHHGIRAANCCDEYMAVMSREHNNANVLCLGARVLTTKDALAIVHSWLKSEFTGGRHQQRIAKFSG